MNCLHKRAVRGANGCASFLIARGFYDRAETYLVRAQEACSFLKDEQALAYTWLYLGQIAEERGGLAEADERYSRGWEIACKIKQQEIMCDFLTRRGEVSINQGDLVPARDYLQQGLTFAREIGHPFEKSAA
jgi:tetratricopeptide (TPR) repeat protein